MHRIGLSAAVAAFLGISLAMAAESGLVSENSARQTALALSKDKNIVHSGLDYKKDGRTVYEYVLVDGDSRIEVEIDGATGEMVKFDKKPIESVKVPPHLRGVVDPDVGAIDMARAREIALERVGGGEVVKAKKDFKKHGDAVYEVEVIADGMEYEFEIDTDSGEVLHYEVERMGDRGPKHHKGPKHPKQPKRRG